MIPPRQDFLSESLEALLARRSMPKRLEGKPPEAEANEVRALLRVLLRSAPTQGYAEWWEQVEVEIGRACRTQGWPGEGQLWDAVDAVAAERREGKASRVDPEAGEETALQALTEYFARHKTEMPGLGHHGRTEALVARGVLRSFREARFRGFALDPQQRAQAIAQAMDPDEWRHHVTVMSRFSRFRGMSYEEVEEVCRGELETDGPPNPGALAQAADRIVGELGRRWDAARAGSRRQPHASADEPDDPLKPKQWKPEDLERIRAVHGLPPKQHDLSAAYQEGTAEP